MISGYSSVRLERLLWEQEARDSNSLTPTVFVPSSNGRTTDFGSVCVGSNPAGTTVPLAQPG